MGSQQLLLIVVGVIVVGVAVVLGFSMFQDSAIKGYQDACVSQSQNLSRECAASIIRGPNFGGYVDASAWAVTIPQPKTYGGVGKLTSIDAIGADSLLAFTWENIGNDPTKSTVITIGLKDGAVELSPIN